LRAREREREEKVGGVVRDTTVWGEGGIETKLAVLKVPRQCPLVLLVVVRFVCGICSILIFKDVGAAAMGQNVVSHWEGYIRATF
jgi:hypothetical protein